MGALRRAAVEGDIDFGSLMAGQSVGLVDSEMTIQQLVDELLNDGEAALNDISERLC